MPGRTPREAFGAFEAPLKRAIACLGSAKILVSQGGADLTHPKRTHSWSLNVGGMELEASPYKAPHLHAGQAILAPDGVITPRAHLPSGRISLESVVLVLIRDFGVRPARDDWEHCLAEDEGVFKLYRTWHDTPPAALIEEMQEVD